MSKVIAIVGKGGVGKTTFSGMLIQHLCYHGRKPILAVDADANSNLNEVLGLQVFGTLGQIREELDQNKRELLRDLGTDGFYDYTSIKMDDAITKGDGYDLLVMGRSQGRGCYCAINGFLSKQIERISGRYNYILVDNEAGMEHISRGVLPAADIVLLVSDSSRRGIQSAGRLKRLVEEIGLSPSTMGLVINMVPDGILDQGSLEEVHSQALNLIGIVPQDDQVYSFDCDGIPLINIPETSPVKKALNDIFLKIGI